MDKWRPLAATRATPLCRLYWRVSNRCPMSEKNNILFGHRTVHVPNYGSLLMELYINQVAMTSVWSRMFWHVAATNQWSAARRTENWNLWSKFTCFLVSSLARSFSKGTRIANFCTWVAPASQWHHRHILLRIFVV